MKNRNTIVGITGALGKVMVYPDGNLRLTFNTAGNLAEFRLRKTSKVSLLGVSDFTCHIGVEESDWTADTGSDDYGIPFIADYVHEAPWSEFGEGSTFTFTFTPNGKGTIATGSIFEMTAAARSLKSELYYSYYMFENWDYDSCGGSLCFAFWNERTFSKSFIPDGGSGYYYPIFMIDTGFWSEVYDLDSQARYAGAHFKAYGEYIKWLAQRLKVFDSTKLKVFYRSNSEAICAAFLCGLKVLERGWARRLALTANTSNIVTTTSTIYDSDPSGFIDPTTCNIAYVNGGEWATLHHIGGKHWTASFAGSDGGQKTKFYHKSGVVHTAFAVPYWLHGSMITLAIRWAYDHVFLLPSTTMKEVRDED